MTDQSTDIENNQDCADLDIVEEKVLRLLVFVVKIIVRREFVILLFSVMPKRTEPCASQ